MTATYKDGKLSFDFTDLIDRVAPDDQVALIESLSCSDPIIRHVAAQIMDRWTENGYSGAERCTAAPDTDGPVLVPALDWAARTVARRSGEVAAREIKRLEDALRRANEDLARRDEAERARQCLRDRYTS
jgi:hypothetical protein